MEPWKERIIAEKKELDIKTVKLMEFLNSDASEHVDDLQRTLMRIQLNIMQTYAAILHARIVG